jgi:hypothetical protein
LSDETVLFGTEYRTFVLNLAQSTGYDANQQFQWVREVGNGRALARHSAYQPALWLIDAKTLELGKK